MAIDVPSGNSSILKSPNNRGASSINKLNICIAIRLISQSAKGVDRISIKCLHALTFAVTNNLVSVALGKTDLAA